MLNVSDYTYQCTLLSSYKQKGLDMKKVTYRALGGACDLIFEGNTFSEVAS